MATVLSLTPALTSTSTLRDPVRVEPYSGSAAEWDAFVRRQRGWTHFHLHGWRDVIDRVFGHECIYLAARGRDGALHGVLPLVRVRSVLFGHYLVSMPFLNYGGPLGTDDAIRLLTAHAVDLARATNVKLLELRSRIPQPIGLPVSHRKLTSVLDLSPGNPDETFKRFESKIRTQIRRSQKDGASVRFGREESVEFFRIFSTHMRELGTPTQPRLLFDTIADVFPEDVWFGSVYLAGRAIASGCGVRWGNEFEMTWSSADTAYRQIRPTMLLFWAFMERSASEGLSLFNFGRSSPGSGTHEFKQKWGTRDEPLWWYGYSRGGESKTPSPDDSSYAWGPRLWKRLPTTLATAIGPRIVRFIP